MTPVPSPHTSCVETIRRADLVAIIDAASKGYSKSIRARLRAVAGQTDAVAAGWFHCHGVTCPARQARMINQSQFEQAYDDAMAARFGRPDRKPFVVRVEG